MRLWLWGPIEGLMQREMEVEGERIDGGLELLEGTFGWIDDGNVQAGAGGMREVDELLFLRGFDCQDYLRTERSGNVSNFDSSRPGNYTHCDWSTGYEDDVSILPKWSNSSLKLSSRKRGNRRRMKCFEDNGFR
jgi:hypothetical protein